MRRKDRKMDKEFGYTVIDKANYGVISMLDENDTPYGIPLSIVREGNVLYFHSAVSGKKINIFTVNPYVSITFVGDTKIPELYSEEELLELENDEKKLISLASKIFTTEFESAIVTGKVIRVETEAEKIKALQLLCKKYTPNKLKLFSKVIKASLKFTNVYMLEIDEITAKRKKFNNNGEELKWGKRE